ncbi:MAG: S8 family serine peptidase [Chloroflexota bacterium]
MSGLVNRIWVGLLLVGMAAGLMFAPHMARAERPANSGLPPVDGEVQQQLLADDSASYWILFAETPDLSPAAQMDWTTRGRYVYEQLTRAADLSQAQVRAALQRSGVTFTPYWIHNAIYVEQSSSQTLQQVLALDGIAAIRAPRELILHDSQRPLFAPVGVQAVESNLERILAPRVWNEGIDGSGVVVANIDTGVHYTHQALVNAYRGNLGGGNYDHNYNWRDPYTNTAAPFDTNGHGTHTMGIMVGRDSANQVGVAPGADWMACRGCKGTNCGDVQLLACAQFVLAPTRTDGSQPNPDLRPQVVNNSWGDCLRSYDDWFQPAVNAWQAAGIYPIFSAGNAAGCGYKTPPGLNTVGNPARYGNVTAVGSSGTNNGQYAAHSNWGPTDNPDTVNPTSGFANLKPQVLAPGVNIRSAFSGADNRYFMLTGTSMSAPHVAGLVALIWQAAPCLAGNYAATETILEQTAVPVVVNDGSPATPSDHPNYAAGWGEINALAAVEAARALCGVNAVLHGTVRAGSECDAFYFLPRKEATVTIYASANPNQPVNILTTNELGAYHVWLLPGSYRVVASAPDLVAQEAIVQTQIGQTVVRNFDLLSDHPCLEVDGESLHIELQYGIRLDAALTLSNRGWQDTPYHIARRQVDEPALLADGGFELGSAAESPWQQYSRQFETPLCSVATCGGGGSALPNSGLWWAWFGGEAGDSEDGWVEQRVRLPAGNAWLRFHLQVQNCGSPQDYLNLSVDEIEIWRQTASGARCSEKAYARSEVSLAAFADGGLHNLRLYGVQSTKTTTNFFVDDLLLWVEADWLAVNPSSGSLAPGEQLPLTVTIDSSRLTPGTHRAVLEFRSGDDILDELMLEVEVEYPHKLYLPQVGR